MLNVNEFLEQVTNLHYQLSSKKCTSVGFTHVLQLLTMLEQVGMPPS
jgi:hypothetical protein